MTDFRIKPLGQVEPDEAAQLLSLCMDSEHDVRGWLWKHHANPFGPSLGSAAYTQTDELVGLRAFMQWELKDDDRTFRAVRAVDTAVHPDFQRRGLFSRLTRAALEELEREEIDLVFNTPNHRSGPGYQKLGWRLLGHPWVWLRPRPSFLCPGRGCQLGKAWRPYDEVREEVWDWPLPSGNAQQLAVHKTVDFLNWRYGRNAPFDYHVLTLEQRGEIVGAAVAHEDQRKGRHGLAVVELLTDGQAGTEQALFRELLGSVDCDYFVLGPAATASHKWSRVRAGFLPLPWRNVTFAVRPVALTKDKPFLHSRRHWSLSLGDLELF